MNITTIGGATSAASPRCAGRTQAYESLAREVKSIVGGPVALTNRTQDGTADPCGQRYVGRG
jgi:hypothetical protein